MFYSETLKAPITALLVERLYGIDPVAFPANAAAIGIYPLIEQLEGYGAIQYIKEGDNYRAIASPLSDVDRDILNLLRDIGIDNLRNAFGVPLPTSPGIQEP